MKIGNMLKLGIVLAAYATAACVMLAFVYAGTVDIIAERAEADLQAALRDVFPDADSFEPLDELRSPDSTVTIQSAFKAMKDGAIMGAALRVSRASYSGPILTLAGVNANGIITGVRIMAHTDTPGLGANAASPSFFVDRPNRITFYGQFTGKHANDPFEVKNDVAVITASTVTSDAVAASVKAAASAVNTWLADGGAR